MSRPRFSIVIPTRERARTLHFALRSCVMQRFNDFEIVVCDNCSSPATREVVESFASPKIRYVRSDVPLAMSDNWELAVAHAQGEFVTVVGDDDALLRHALVEADRLISLFDAKAIRWDSVYYNWPDHPLTDKANRLQIAVDSECRLTRSSDAVRNVATRRADYDELPTIYNSFIRWDVIDELRARTGRVFKGMSPDIYSGFAFAHLMEHYLSVLRPMAIAGQSGKCNGQACVNGAGDGGVAKEFFTLNEDAGLGWSNRVPRVEKSIAAHVAESFEQFRTNLCPRAKYSVTERMALLDAIIRDLERHPNLSAEELDKSLFSIAEWSKNDPQLAGWCKRRFAKVPRPSGQTPGGSSQWCRGFGRDKSDFGRSKFDIDAKEFGIIDTDGVAEFYERLFGCNMRPITASPPSATTSTATVKDLLPPVMFRMVAAALGRPRRLGRVIATDTA